MDRRTFLKGTLAAAVAAALPGRDQNRCSLAFAQADNYVLHPQPFDGLHAHDLLTICDEAASNIQNAFVEFLFDPFPEHINCRCEVVRGKSVIESCLPAERLT